MSEDIDKHKDNEDNVNRQKENKLDEFKDNDTNMNNQNNERIDKCIDNDDKLNDKREDDDRDKKKGKSLKWCEDKKIKWIESLKGSGNFDENKLNKVDELKDKNAEMVYQNNDKYDNYKDNNKRMNHKK